MRRDGTFSRSDFVCDPEGNAYVRPGGKELKKYNRASSKPRHGLRKETPQCHRVLRLCQ
jgi:hypothetical protein